MNKIYFLGAAALTAMSFCGCSDTIEYDNGTGEGKVLIRPMIESDVKVVSRAGETDEQLASSTIIWISNSKGVVRKYSGIDEVPAGGIALVADHYIAEAWAGDSVPASFDARYFKGREPFTISNGSTIQVDLECKIANSLVRVEYEGDVLDYISDCSMTVGHKAGKLVFADEDAARTGYFMMPSFDKDLTYSFTAKSTSDGKPVTYTGVIADAKPATQYVLRVRHDAVEEEDLGGALVTIVVDESEVEISEEVPIYSAPLIRGINFDITQPQTGEAYKLTEKKLWITATAAISAVSFDCPGLGKVLGMSGDDFELFGMVDWLRDDLVSKGFHYEVYNHDDTGFSEMKITLEDRLMNLFGDGEYPVNITVSDAKGRTSSAVLNILVTDAKVLAVAVEPGALTNYTDHVTVYGTVLSDGLEDLGFNYRRKGDLAWMFAPAEQTGLSAGDTYSAVLTGLLPATEYEYQAVSGAFNSANILTVTTEAALQLKNGSFEDWTSEGGIVYPSASKDNLFWDTGNTGAKMASTTLTEKNTDMSKVHEGNASARLESKYAAVFGIGKFAAGNIFYGEYLNTEGTDGVLGWGRPFTSRPKALKGYVHYTPKEITDASSDCPDQSLVKGAMDKGIIYVALLTDKSATGKPGDYNGKKFPVIVKTNAKNRNLFDKNDDNVVAYGEVVFSEATSGEKLVEFEIPLEYFKEDVRPSNIMVVCAASKGGDYYVGGRGSVMYVDDFQLVY